MLGAWKRPRTTSEKKNAGARLCKVKGRHMDDTLNSRITASTLESGQNYCIK